MDTLGKLLDILFRRIPPERILNNLRQNPYRLDYQKNEQEVFLRYADTALWGYSADEQIQIFQYLSQITRKLSQQLHTNASVFLPLVEFGRQVLTLQGDTPVCRFKDVLRWREVYHLLSQDTVVCAYIAFCDVLSPVTRVKFAWPATIKTDNGILEQMLNQGLAENHCHLNGSTQSFALSWYKLMNYPAESSEWLSGFPMLLQSVTGRGPEDNVIAIDERVRLAALARATLFKALHSQDFTSAVTASSAGAGGQCSTKVARFCSKDEFFRVAFQRFSSVADTADTTRLLRLCYGMPIPIPDGQAVCMDYALERHIFLPVADSPYRILAGERNFLYSCFYACFSGAFTEFEQELFYFYLLVKTAFRGEMIQVNKQVGFENFANYEKRKDLIWENDPYWWEAYRMALNAPIKTDAVKSLESRFSPKPNPSVLFEKVRRYDLAKWFADRPYAASPYLTEVEFEQALHSGQLSKEPHFYVLHYPKKKDTSYSKILPFVLCCRHEALREEVKQTTIATADALVVSNYLCGRIRGIDGCANEVDCRPEVFATAFRYLRSLQTGSLSGLSTMIGPPESRICSTYHAGEDFYDIADGLRAIDEAVSFLELQRGDRIGHALALGVDPITHYRTKSECIVLPKQNYLDNLVWLLYRGRDLNIQMDPQQYGMLQQEALRYMREIYGDAIRKNQWSVTLLDYYNSMMLRGDAPQLYQSTSFVEPRFYNCRYDQFQISHTRLELTSLRNDREVAGLCYYYHYGYHERIKGAESITVPITPGYRKVVRQAQDALRTYLEHKGIIIECNPTSNVLIGTFGSYANHPIFRLNSDGLKDADLDGSTLPMQVCINTDDLGVFDTSLSFEYALLFRAMVEKVDKEGERVYTSSEIMHYLDNIRKMGLQAVFPKPLS